MKTINCGLLLRSPGESAYSAYRRFLWANGGLRVSVLRETLLEILERDTPPRSTSTAPSTDQFQLLSREQLSTAALARACEHLTCTSLKLPIPPVTYTPAWESEQKLPTMRKNCTACSAGLFHSALFDLPWLTHCPVHQLPLTETCQACHQPWPTVAQLPKRLCTVCGIRITFAELRAASALTTNPGYRSLERLGMALKIYEQRPALFFFPPPVAGSHSNGGHRVLPCEVLYQLDTSIKDDPIVQAIASAHGPPVLIAQGSSMLRKLHMPKEIEVSSNPIPTWMPRAHLKVLRKVMSAIAAHSPPTHHLNLLPKTSSILELSLCPHCIAFSIWYDLITYQSMYRRFAISLLGYELFPERGRPLVPYRIDEICYQECHYQLPSSLQRLLYYLDLWVCFVDLHYYVSGYIHALQFAPETPVAALWHSPCRHPIIRNIEFSFDSPDFLRLIIPKSFFTFAPEPLSESTGQLCTPSAGSGVGLSSVQRERFIRLNAERETMPLMVADDILLANPRITILEKSSLLVEEVLHQELERFMREKYSSHWIGFSTSDQMYSISALPFASSGKNLGYTSRRSRTQKR